MEGWKVRQQQKKVTGRIWFLLCFQAFTNTLVYFYLCSNLNWTELTGCYMALIYMNDNFTRLDCLNKKKDKKKIKRFY